MAEPHTPEAVGAEQSATQPPQTWQQKPQFLLLLRPLKPLLRQFDRGLRPLKLK